MKWIEKIEIQDFFESNGQNGQLIDQINSLYDDIDKPRFYLKEIGISAKVINDWIKAEILDKSEEGKWRQFSFKEAIWINFISELRYFGVSLREIKNIKSAYFDKNPVFEVEAIQFYFKNENSDEAFKKIAESYRSVLKSYGDDEKAVSLILKDFFSTIIVFTITQSFNPVYIFSKELEGFFNLIKLKDDFFECNEKISQIGSMIFSKSFACINIKNLIARFFEEDKPNADLKFYIGLLKSKEQDLIKMVRSGDYSKIIINLEEEKIVLTKAMRKKDDALLRQLARLMKKGDYKDIELSARDGKIIKFNAFDLTK